MSPAIHTLELIVPGSAIDRIGHVNNLSYLQWCLDAAEEHWQLKANPELRSKYVWFVLSHYIEYKSAAFEGDSLKIETWVSYSEGVKSERQFRIKNALSDKLLVEARTLWCLIDPNTQRPVKIPEEIRNLFL